MKILFLTKRFTTGKDFLRERYGRMYELSRALSEQGHDVTGVYFSYQYGMVAPDTSAEPVNWIGYAVDYTRVAGWLRYLQGLDALVKVKRPDIIIGASDSPHVIVAAWLAKRHDLPYIVDLYDNFESFGLTRLPLIRGLFRKALRQADGISVVTDELGGHVQSVCRPKSLPKTVENAVPEGVFTVINSRDARE